jgi:hypothetical protein
MTRDSLSIGFAILNDPFSDGRMTVNNEMERKWS